MFNTESSRQAFDSFGDPNALNSRRQCTTAEATPVAAVTLHDIGVVSPIDVCKAVRAEKPLSYSSREMVSLSNTDLRVGGWM